MEGDIVGVGAVVAVVHGLEWVVGAQSGFGEPQDG